VTNDKRKILRALAYVGDELRRADDRLRNRLTVAGLTAEMQGFLLSSPARRKPSVSDSGRSGWRARDGHGLWWMSLFSLRRLLNRRESG
jgi:hypothetical protein